MKIILFPTDLWLTLNHPKFSADYHSHEIILFHTEVENHPISPAEL